MISNCVTVFLSHLGENGLNIIFYKKKKKKKNSIYTLLNSTMSILKKE